MKVELNRVQANTILSALYLKKQGCTPNTPFYYELEHVLKTFAEQTRKKHIHLVENYTRSQDLFIRMKNKCESINDSKTLPKQINKQSFYDQRNNTIHVFISMSGATTDGLVADEVTIETETFNGRNTEKLLEAINIKKQIEVRNNAMNEKEVESDKCTEAPKDIALKENPETNYDRALKKIEKASKGFSGGEIIPPNMNVPKIMINNEPIEKYIRKEIKKVLGEMFNEK
ncbi:hypothetical protein [Enterococcus phage TJE4]|uniref:Uncharacterized protein n=1 Tax=Enterococcus phage 9183 TaxID=2763102 RepID=A0A7L7SMT0_9CAUD|nr:hypothetical protein KNV65_gp027 [Enterococcus phage 9183]QOC57520.1 hypothetical protein phi9183_ORF027 [Enterococcus phage 9183]UVD42857.1 hypothetical protein [Enterococcus phage TJE4]